MSATKNSHDWHCEEHGTYGWRGESCRQCPEAPSKIKSLRAQIAELEEHNAILQEQLDLQIPAGVMAQQMRRIGELEKQNAALLVAIEAKDAVLTKLLPTLLNWMYQEEASYGKNFSGARTDKARELVAKTKKALALSPSTEPLEERDRKRDAKLLRHIFVSMYELADLRESGEWQPELGD